MGKIQTPEHSWKWERDQSVRTPERAMGWLVFCFLGWFCCLSGPWKLVSVHFSHELTHSLDLRARRVRSSNF